jgi:hypothetical protein
MIKNMEHIVELWGKRKSKEGDDGELDEKEEC